ncbi:MAG: type II toxin-antitoxin system HigB family toxin [Alphaproteobacteria bacterium]|nr:type II toxin-antitoxin system HigB family toxin [Alphaproteobacteria bacterium]
MKIINYLQLQKFWQRYPDAEEALKAWFYEMSAQTWQEGRDVLNHFSNAKLLGKEEISFEIIPDKYHIKAIFKSSRQVLLIQQIAKYQKRTLQNVSSFLDNTEEIMTIRPIYTQDDLQETVDRLEDLFNAEEGTPEYDQFVILTELVLAFQRENTKIDFPDPVEAIRYHM